MRTASSASLRGGRRSRFGLAFSPRAARRLPAFTTLAYWESVILLAGFFGIVFWRLLTGRISLNGLLEGDRADGSTYFSPGRVQLLIATILFAFYYLTQIVNKPSAFPPVPQELLVVLGGSQAVYLGGKARAMLFGGPAKLH